MDCKPRPLVGFRLMARSCGKQSRNPKVCYHPDNPGTLGSYAGGKCSKSSCPVWRAIEKANQKKMEDDKI